MTSWKSAVRALVWLLVAGLPGGGDELLAQTREPGTFGDTVPLTLGEAVNRALAFYPTVRITETTSETARASLDQAKSAWWPEVTLAGSLTRYQRPMLATPIHDFTLGSTPEFDETLIQGGGYLGFTLFDGGGRVARIRGARSEVAAADADLGGVRQRLIAEVAGAYVEVLTRARILDAHERRVEALESELDRVLQLRDVGRAADLDVLRVEAALASSRSDRVTEAAALGVARRGLARRIGLSADEAVLRSMASLALVGDSLPGRDTLTTVAVASNPEIAAARWRQSAAQARVSAARSVRWPRLEVSGSWVDRGGVDADHELQWAAGVQVAVPLFTGGRIDREIARARAGARGAEERVRLAVTETEGVVDRLVSAYEEALARARSLETAVARSEEVVRIERLRLETGTGTQTDYLDAEAELLAVRAGLAQTRHARILARVELARVLGELTPAWLEQNLEGGR